jgi:hypothetical protein
MPDTVPCPYCAEPIHPDATKCKHCGEWLDERMLGERGPARTTVIVRESQAVPALASFFVPGLGQLIQGRTGVGIGMFVLAVLGWFTIFCGWVMHIVAAVEAAQYKPR